MLTLRPILHVIGLLLLVLSVAMLLPFAVDLAVDNKDWQPFLLSSFLSAFVGGALLFTNKGSNETLTLRDAFFLTTASWVILPIFAALPFLYSELSLSIVDAYFEAMSGITTTGATVIEGLDNLPPGILLWRAILQWLGGIGIIVVALAVLPMLRIGGMQLFRMESSDRSDKILPRAAQVSGAISWVYISLTFCCFISLKVAGMGYFDAFAHALTTVSTGGFSTHDSSIAFFNSQTIETIMIVFMIISALPFVLYIKFLYGNPRSLFKDTQVRWFFSILWLSVVGVTSWLSLTQSVGLWESFRYTLFSLTSILTSAGFTNTNYSAWGEFAFTFIFLLTVVGGCSGSTSGGIKILRYQVLYQTARTQIMHLLQPHAVLKPQVNGKYISEQIGSSVMSFFILFAFCFMVVACLLSLFGVDFVTSMSAAAATLSNLGPGLGDVIGPLGSFKSLPDAAKSVLIFAMILGRLEIFTVLVLFAPAFWRR